MDILKDLRDGKPCRWTGVCGEMSAVGGCTCGEAADEIERLREALKKIVEPIGPSYPDSLIHNDLEIIEIAQAALKDGE